MLTKTVLKRCVERGVTPVGPAFPGECAGAADGAFADCLMDRAKCRFCLAVNTPDDIDPALDCDLFDDDELNGSWL